MTKEFLLEMKKAIEQAKLYTKHLDKESVLLRKQNQKYVDNYKKLVLAAVATYNFDSNWFNKSLFNPKVLALFGNPTDINIQWADNNGFARIVIDYYNSDRKVRGIVPDYISNKNSKYDSSIINFMLKDEEITVWDDNYYEKHSIMVTFNAKELINAREKYNENNLDTKKKIG